MSHDALIAPLHLVVVGHQDHGKSTLVGRLAHDVQRLRAGQRIDVADLPQVDFAHLVDAWDEERQLGQTMDSSTSRLAVGDREVHLIDVPGHAELIRHMVSGASAADAALLVVAADAGPAAQTRQHAQLLRLLGVRQVILVLTKLDAIDFDEARCLSVATEANELLQSLDLEVQAAVPVCALTGSNVAQRSAEMPWYDGAPLWELLSTCLAPPRQQAMPLRFTVQDVWPEGARTLVVGKVLSGNLAVGDEIHLLPDQRTVHVQEIARFPASSDPATAGECVALQLYDTAEVKRGTILAHAPLPDVCHTVHCRMFWWGEEPLSIGQSARVHCSTQQWMATVVEIGVVSLETAAGNGSSSTLPQHAIGLVTLEGSEPLVAEKFASFPPLGRLAIAIGERVCGAGTIVA